jgi:branched-chain amino acid transport system permease protein
MLNELLQAIVSGLLLGLVYALLSVGFSLTWGSIGVINISHAALAVFGAYLGYFFPKIIPIDPIISLIVIVPLFYFIGVLLNKTIYTAIRRRSRNITFTSMVLTFGLAVALENAMMWIFSADTRVLKTDYILSSFHIGPVYMSGGQIVSSLLALLSLLLVYLFLYYSYTGKSVRAFEQEPEGAALTGINTKKVTSITSGVAVASAGVAGVCLSMIFPFNSTIHMAWLITIFLITILGKVGNVLGTLVGGLSIGLIITVGGVWLPHSFINFVMFIILIFVLIIRKKEDMDT